MLTFRCPACGVLTQLIEAERAPPPPLRHEHEWLARTVLRAGCAAEDCRCGARRLVILDANNQVERVVGLPRGASSLASALFVCQAGMGMQDQWDQLQEGLSHEST